MTGEVRTTGLTLAGTVSILSARPSSMAETMTLRTKGEVVEW